jgi:hypothetical protein
MGYEPLIKREGAYVYTKERSRVPSLNTGGLVCTRWTKQGLGGNCLLLGPIRKVDWAAAEHLLSPFSSHFFRVTWLYDCGFGWTSRGSGGKCLWLWWAGAQHLLKPLFWGKNWSILRWALEIPRGLKVSQLLRKRTRRRIKEGTRRFLNICTKGVGNGNQLFPQLFRVQMFKVTRRPVKVDLTVHVPLNRHNFNMFWIFYLRLIFLKVVQNC